jgi:predicted glycosyltransferase
LQKKSVLVCPLNWGLGHASRDVEIINKLLILGFDVVVGADGPPLEFLKQQFPHLPYIVIKSYTIRYAKKGWLLPFRILLQTPGFAWRTYQEHQQLKSIYRQSPFDVVISDNRYGLWHRKAHSVFITHQLQILLPKSIRWAEKLLRRLNYYFISRFNEIWVPDNPMPESIAGKLSNPGLLPPKVCYIGTLSRFKAIVAGMKHPGLNEAYDLLIVLSGPEPQRTIFENILLKQLAPSDMKFLLVQGKPHTNLLIQTPGKTIINHLSTSILAYYLAHTPVIICRSGYSGIMDLMAMERSAILVPTPGQTEQEYLATYISEKNWFYTVGQKDFNLKHDIEKFRNFKPAKFPDYSDLFMVKLKNLQYF